MVDATYSPSTYWDLGGESSFYPDSASTATADGGPVNPISNHDGATAREYALRNSDIPDPYAGYEESLGGGGSPAMAAGGTARGAAVSADAGRYFDPADGPGYGPPRQEYQRRVVEVPGRVAVPISANERTRISEGRQRLPTWEEKQADANYWNNNGTADVSFVSRVPVEGTARSARLGRTSAAQLDYNTATQSASDIARRTGMRQYTGIDPKTGDMVPNPDFTALQGDVRDAEISRIDDPRGLANRVVGQSNTSTKVPPSVAKTIQEQVGGAVNADGSVREKGLLALQSDLDDAKKALANPPMFSRTTTLQSNVEAAQRALDRKKKVIETMIPTWQRSNADTSKIEALIGASESIGGGTSIPPPSIPRTTVLADDGQHTAVQDGNSVTVTYKTPIKGHPAGYSVTVPIDKYRKAAGNGSI